MGKAASSKDKSPKRAKNSKPTQAARRLVAKAGQRIAAKVSAKSRSMSKDVSKPEKRAKAKSAAEEQEQAPVNYTPVPVADNKPRKNQAGLHARELEHFRDLLLAKRRELVGDMSSMEREALRTSGGTNLSNLPLHMADQGTDNYEQEFTLGLMEKDRNLLRDINAALGKIQDGTYGVCEGTGKPISKPRLEAQPWARYSIEHARKLEKGMIR